MKVKTNLKAGLETKGVQKLAQDVWAGAQSLAKGAGPALAPVTESVKNTVTSSSFWTWPF
jgi:hypothetical protein